MMTSATWYVVKQPDGHCEVMQDEIIPNAGMSDDASAPDGNAEGQPRADRWGPFESQAEAIARRVGLIRAGKCQPL
ncbi:MAG: hypothetical protein KME15_09740 [Drouetiella hepatica Uher 2000/2452]|jgi:hypothetical protein|uniref:DDE transposase family protein n=1 Tax=Drouetiella hepatica Uher 2000/2452 TaxID=904376 RepID=A0A951QA28_9CYAN|nr:hypothetical protein [Drouetiella hepatica Uher 2000/2452]